MAAMFVLAQEALEHQRSMISSFLGDPWVQGSIAITVLYFVGVGKLMGGKRDGQSSQAGPEKPRPEDDPDFPRWR